MVAKSEFKNVSIEVNCDMELLKPLAHSVRIPTSMLPMLEKNPELFACLLKNVLKMNATNSLVIENYRGGGRI